MKDKYELTREQNIFLAKKLLTDNIYCGLKMEGSKITFPETQTILDGVNVPNVTLNDIQAILNMRDAWRYLFNTIDAPVTVEYLCKINEYVARNESLEWGVLRTASVGKSEADYKPNISEKQIVEKELNTIINSDMTITQKALRYFSWGIRSQLFWVGNKRTSLLCANKILIQGGKGIFTVPAKSVLKFNSLLTDFYETNNISLLESFLYNTSLHGITFTKENSSPKPEL